MDIETTKNVSELKAMLNAVTAQINRTPEEEEEKLNNLNKERNKVILRLRTLGEG